MNRTLTAGQPHEGGFYAGQILIAGQPYALIVAPKAAGQHKESVWNKSHKIVEGALAYDDGLANTRAMAEAGSKLGKWALGLTINGFSDWYLPSQDELEILYRNLKPTPGKNWCYARSGINLSAIEPARPYTPDLPAQTSAEPFLQGAAEAFDPDWYWSSTQHVSNESSAWLQDFGDGDQYGSREDDTCRARAVRRSAI